MKSQEQIKEKLEKLNNLLDNMDSTQDEITEIKIWQWIDALSWVLEK